MLDDRVGISSCDISTICRVEPRANQLDEWRTKKPGLHHDEAQPCRAAWLLGINP
jgi:hypothetical protein